ncbi:hypothetical protein BJ912DRAFT_921752 [Pholiota molesta]|nr:hypothetical protein BJ912DRAFT_921752 [Pholiota molesta]
MNGWTVMYSRAGLVALVLAFLITFITAAPVPTGNIAPLAPPHTSLSHRIPHSNSRSSQASLDITQTHAGNQVLPSIPIAGDPLAARNWSFLSAADSTYFPRSEMPSNIKRAAQNVGNRFKSVAQKAGHFFKTYGAKIAKVGLKIAATVTKVASKVVGFIPGVGKVLSKGLARASSAANAASNRIHTDIGGRLGKAMAGMDEAEKITGYLPRGLQVRKTFSFRNATSESLNLMREIYASRTACWMRGLILKSGFMSKAGMIWKTQLYTKYMYVACNGRVSSDSTRHL